ncbi:MAG: XdhC family protein [Spirochaetia bacterium]
MFDIYQQLEEWRGDPDKLPVYLATVISIEGSAVRGAGATMGIAADGSLTGSVSGGCIESTVIEAVRGLRANRAAQQLTFCPNDDPLVGAPSPCGGTVKVCVYPYSSEVGAAVAARGNGGQDILWGICTAGPPGWTGLSFALDESNQIRVSPPIGAPAVVIPSGEVETKLTPLLPREYGTFESESGEGEAGPAKIKFFIHYHPPIPHAAVVGGSHIGEALVLQLKALGWRVSLIDPRETFAPQERFRAADRLLHLWPQEAFAQLGVSAGTQVSAHTAVAAITHSEQIDDAAVAAALDNGCFYVGVLGSRSTYAERIERLKSIGYSDEQLERVHGPIGLDIGARNPEEIALAIAAQMVQDYRKGR